MARLPARRDDRGRSGGFTYKPRTADQIKKRVARKGGRFDSIYKPGFDSWRAREGDNLIRFLPPTWDDHEHYGYTIWVHRGIGPDDSTYLCPRKMLNKPCPICDAMKDAKDAGESEEAKALAPVERVAYWIVDRDADDPDKPILYDISWTMDRDILSLTVNDRTGEILMIDDPNKGYDVTIKRYGTGMRTKYSGFAIARDDSPVHDDEKVQDEILDYIGDNPIPSVLNFYDADYLERILSGTEPEKDQDLDKPADEAPARGRRDDRDRGEERDRRPARDEVAEEPAPVRARRPARDEVVEEEEVEERGARAEERESRRSSPRREAPVDEEVNEEEIEVQEERTTSSRRGNGRNEEPERDRGRDRDRPASTERVRPSERGRDRDRERPARR